MKRKISAAFLFFSLALSFQANAKEVVIGLENTYYPPRYFVEAGKPAGINVEFLTKAFKDLGYDIVWKVQPVSQLYTDLFQGKIDFKFPDNPEWKYQAKEGKTIFYSNVVQADRDGLFVKPKKVKKPIEKIKKVGTLHGFTVVSLEHNIRNGNIQVIEYNDTTTLMQAAIKGEVDAAYLSHGVGNYYLNKILRDPEKLIFDDSLPTANNPYYLSTLKDDGLLKKLNVWIEKNK